MTLLLLIPLLLLPLTAVVVAARSQWVRRKLAYACIGFATVLPLWAAGCAKSNDNQHAENESENESENDTDPGNTLGDTSRVLEFRIAVDPQTQGLDEYQSRLDTQGPEAKPNAPMRWFAIKDLQRFFDDDDQLKITQGMIDAIEQASGQEREDAHASLFHMFKGMKGVVARPYRGRLFILLHNETDRAMTQDEGWSVTQASVGQDTIGFRCVNFSLDESGAKQMRALTKANHGQPMAIVIDEQIVAAPMIQTTLTESIQISGQFTHEQVNSLSQAILKTGSGRSP